MGQGGPKRLARRAAPGLRTQRTQMCTLLTVRLRRGAFGGGAIDCEAGGVLRVEYDGSLLAEEELREWYELPGWLP